MVLMSPALDAGVTNPEVDSVNDPLLNPAISKRNGQWWARGLETEDDPDGTKNPLASPLFGSLADLPPIAVYAGSLDSRTPDVLVLQEKALATPGADFTFELRRGQIHDWTIFPFLPDAHVERPKIYADLGLTTE
jgi:acetyl esterase/lipase